MGCGGSSQSSAPASSQKQQTAPPMPPYHGPKCEYHFENYQIPYQTDANCVYLADSNLQITTFSTGVYLPSLVALYEKGFRLLSFTAMPGSITSGLFTTNVQQVSSKSQAICRKMREDEKIEKYSIKVVKSVLPAQVFSCGVYRLGNTQSTANTLHIFQTIQQETSGCARLLSIEITGGNSQNVPQTSSSITGGMGGKNNPLASPMFGHNPAMILGIDIFFEVPQFPNPPRYIYECVTVPLTAEFVIEFMTGGKWSVKMDWQTPVTKYLNAGWKLVEVFLDQNNSSLTNRPVMATKVTMNLNCIFIFEKKESDLNDNTPIYEATMAEYQAPGQASIGVGVCKVTTNVEWEPSISQMGSYGWELVRGLETPAILFGKIEFMNFNPKIKKVMWMFYQRKIVHESPEQST